MDFVWGTFFQPLDSDVVEDLVLQHFLGGGAELVVELEHRLQELKFVIGGL